MTGNSSSIHRLLTECIVLPELTVNQEHLYSSKHIQGNAQIAQLLLDNFDATAKTPYFSGLNVSEVDEPALASRDVSLLHKIIGSHLLEEYETEGRHRWKHAYQRKVLEKAIRLLLKAYTHSGEDTPAGKNIAQELGRAYLYRSRIIRPKGFTVPAKKLESLQKAFNYCNKANGERWAAHIKGLVALELDRCEEPLDDMATVLQNATDGVDLSKYEHHHILEYYRMKLSLKELEGNFDDGTLKDIFQYSGEGLELEHLKVAMLVRDCSDKQPDCLQKLIERLKEYPLSHPLWEETVNFIRYLYPNHNWGSLSLKIWEIAEEKSLSTSSIHLRWHWSRQRDLYDLAFLASIDKKIEQAFEIAESSKNKPAFTLQAMERMGKDVAVIREAYEEYAKALAGGYIKGSRKSFKIESEKIDSGEKTIAFKELSKDIILVSLYLVHLKGKEKGYALIYKDGNWSYKEFNFKSIWRKYLAWQTSYLDLPSQQRSLSAPQLESLCLALGRELNFLFEYQKEKDFLFIPHDFLHRVPLHGAMLDNEILIAQHRCSYIPSYHNIATASASQGDKRILLQYYDASEIQKADYFDDIAPKFDAEKSTRKARLNDIVAAAIRSPSLLAIRCHGVADAMNPFFSKLLLEDEPTLIDMIRRITEERLDFSGTAIFLGACETDFTVSLDTPLDEHISVAAMFLDRKALLVIGAMWEANDSNVVKILIGGNDVLTRLAELQKKLCENYLDKKENKSLLYDCLCFKVYQHSILG